jgi:hypothetical protein
VVVTLFTNFTHLSYSFINYEKLRERYIKFMNNVTIILSDKQMIIIKFVDLDELYNLVVYDFFIWNHLMFQNLIWSCHFLKFIIWIIQTKSNEKMNKMKFVHLDEFYNIGIGDFSIWNHLVTRKIYLNFLYFEIQNLYSFNQTRMEKRSKQKW